MLPKGWTIDPEGNPITDPKEDATKKGAMVLLGSTPELGIYKGFGLNIMVDILSSILAGSRLSTRNSKPTRQLRNVPISSVPSRYQGFYRLKNFRRAWTT